MSTTTTISENNKGMQEIMEILFDKKEEIGDGNYLRCCDILKNIHKEVTTSSEIKKLEDEVESWKTLWIQSELRLINMKKKIQESIVENMKKKASYSYRLLSSIVFANVIVSNFDVSRLLESIRYQNEVHIYFKN